MAASPNRPDRPAALALPAFYPILDVEVAAARQLEPLTVLRDVCGLEPDEALSVTRWAAEALIATALDSTVRDNPLLDSGRARGERSATRPR